MTPCDHVWTAWAAEERSLGPGVDTVYIMARRCVLCHVVDEGKGDWNV